MSKLEIYHAHVEAMLIRSSDNTAAFYRKSDADAEVERLRGLLWEARSHINHLDTCDFLSGAQDCAGNPSECDCGSFDMLKAIQAELDNETEN